MRSFAIAVLAVLVSAGIAAAGVTKKAPAPMEPTTPAKQTISLTATGLLDCTGAVEVTLDNVYTGDNTGLLSNVAGYPCNPWYEPGGEVVFHLFLAEPTMFTASVQGDFCDVDLAVLNQCDEGAGCIDVVDATCPFVSAAHTCARELAEIELTGEVAAVELRRAREREPCRQYS